MPERRLNSCCSIVLVEAVTSALKRCGSDQAVSNPAVLTALCTQLINKWNYAADKYRVDHPGVLPPNKPGEGPRPCTRVLPIDEAEIRMATWIPWAIAKIRMDFDRLAAMFNALTVEQLGEVEAEPEAEAEALDDI